MFFFVCVVVVGDDDGGGGGGGGGDDDDDDVGVDVFGKRSCCCFSTVETTWGAYKEPKGKI